MPGRRDNRDHRRPSSAFGIPIEVDPELTPPPQEPPKLDDIDGSDTIAPPVRAVLENQRQAIADVTHWLSDLAPLRDGTRLDRIEERVVSLAQSMSYQSATIDSIKPQLDYWRNATDSVERQLPKLIGSIEAMTLLVGGMDQRLRQVELTIEQHKSEFDDYRERYVESKAQREDALARITKLERIEQDRVVVQQALAKVERKKSIRAGGAVGAVGAVVVAVGQHVVDWLRHL